MHLCISLSWYLFQMFNDINHDLLIIELRFDVLIFNWMYFYCFLSVNNLPNKKIVGQIVLMFRLEFLKRHTKLILNIQNVSFVTDDLNFLRAISSVNDIALLQSYLVNLKK